MDNRQQTDVQIDRHRHLCFSAGGIVMVMLTATPRHVYIYRHTNRTIDALLHSPAAGKLKGGYWTHAPKVALFCKRILKLLQKSPTKLRLVFTNRPSNFGNRQALASYNYIWATTHTRTHTHTHTHVVIYDTYILCLRAGSSVSFAVSLALTDVRCQPQTHTQAWAQAQAQSKTPTPLSTRSTCVW